MQLARLHVLAGICLGCVTVKDQAERAALKRASYL